jgi:hypothetical protein
MFNLFYFKKQLWAVLIFFTLMPGISFAHNDSLKSERYLNSSSLPGEELNDGSKLLEKRYPNSVRFDKRRWLALRRSTVANSPSVKMEFANSLTGSAFVLRATKSPEITIHRPDVHFLRVFGLNYERSICRHWALGLGYSGWLQFSPWLNNKVEFYPYQYKIGGDNKRGTVQTLTNYKMIDFSGKYYHKFGRHEIDAGLGVSYTWGTNTVIDTIYVLPLDNYVIAHNERASYTGCLVFIGYDYSLLHNRLSVGYRITWRDYFKMFSPQLLNGVAVKFNF